MTSVRNGASYLPTALDVAPDELEIRCPRCRDHAIFDKGVVECINGHFLLTHVLSWPDDAYYRWEIRGVTLWAWSRDHACRLLEFIKAADRNPHHYPRYHRSLRKLPRTVLLAKNRDLVIRKMSRLLGSG